MPTPAELGARPGDVAHVRSRSAFGWAIRRALPGCWGNHDGIVVYAEERWGIAEALLASGIVVTPWETYERRIAAGKSGLAFLRPKDMPEHVSHVVQMNALEMAASDIRYDWRAIADIWWQLAFKTASPGWAREWAWYCTEAVMACHHNAGPEWDVWGKQLPTPLTTEKRQRAGRLTILGVYEPPGCPGYPRM